ncbi:MAG: HAMP domain-containing sensor histidine kinase [Pseudomonadota bacterium]
MISRSSLAFRLIAAASVVSVVLLIAAGILLSTLFTAAVERSLDARLQAVMDGLLASVELEKEVPKINNVLADTRFEIPLAGWYWQISSLDGDPTRQVASASLLDERLPLTQFKQPGRRPGNRMSGYLKDQSGNTLRVIEQRFTLFGSKEQYSFLVAGNFDELQTEVSAFNNALIAVLGLLGVGLVAAILLQVRYGLRPLSDLQGELSEIREGEQEGIAGSYPDEIQTVTDELNLLLKSNTEVIERARTQVGNLAHALKTPLSVLTNEAGIHGGTLGTKVSEQAGVMRDQVSMYLDRARRAARAKTIGSSTDASDVVKSIVRTLERIHVDRKISVKSSYDTDIRFRGERQDLEEMVGNLLDNAFKWTNGRVAVGVRPSTSPIDKRIAWIDVCVEDNGPGLPDGGAAIAMERGKRLDETKPGSGLGLSIVSETAAMYGGKLFLDRSDLGGLRAVLTLPAARRGDG